MNFFFAFLSLVSFFFLSLFSTGIVDVVGEFKKCLNHKRLRKFLSSITESANERMNSIDNLLIHSPCISGRFGKYICAYSVKIYFIVQRLLNDFHILIAPLSV